MPDSVTNSLAFSVSPQSYDCRGSRVAHLAAGLTVFFVPLALMVLPKEPIYRGVN